MNKDNIEEDWWTNDMSFSQINRLFDPKDIAADIRNLSVDTLLTRIKNDKIDLLPKFQRAKGLWNNVIKSQFIESILLNFPIPPLYFASDQDDIWVVIDGLQRLSTLQSFVLDNEFELKGLSVLVNLNGCKFESLERQFQRRIIEYPMVVYLVRPGAPRYAVYDIFRRLNTGGVALNPQEIREALNPRASDFLENLIVDKDLSKTLSVTNKRKANGEIVLRFIAFFLNSYHDYQPPMFQFLDRTMAMLDSAENHILAEIKEQFSRAFDFIIDEFGKEVFFKAGGKTHKRFKKALFEIWMVTIAKFDDHELQILLLQNRKPSFDIKYLNLLDEKDFLESISVTTGSRKSVFTRFYLFEKLFESTL